MNGRVATLAFSLIELMSAVGIVVALLALAFPAFNHLGVKRGQSRCAANLRQLHMAISAYASDHLGEVPVDRANVSTGSTWYIPLQTYIFPNQAWNYGWNRNRGPFFCPGNKLQTGWTNYAINGGFYDATVGGVNMGPAPAGAAQQAYLEGRQSLRFVNRAHPETVLLIDSGTPQGGMAFVSNGARWNDRSWSAAYPMHGDSLNVLFVGGNVMQVRVFPREVNDKGDLNELKASWFWPLRLQ